MSYIALVAVAYIVFSTMVGIEPKEKLETLRKLVEEARDNECAKMKLFANQTPEHVFHRGRMYAFDEVLDALRGDWVLSSTEK